MPAAVDDPGTKSMRHAGEHLEADREAFDQLSAREIRLFGDRQNARQDAAADVPDAGGDVIVLERVRGHAVDESRVDERALLTPADDGRLRPSTRLPHGLE